MDKWINTEDRLPAHGGYYWVVIEGDSECGEFGAMLYDFDDYVVLMSLTVEDDGPDNPPYITGTAAHDETWDLVTAWWNEKVSIPEWKS